MSIHQHLIKNLKWLRLPAMVENLELREREARENSLGYIEFLSLLIQDQISSRETNMINKKLQKGNIDPRFTFETFDFKFNNDALPSQTIRDLATCLFVERNQGLILCGPPGIGKTHIAHAIAHEACRRGYDAHFCKTHKLLELLKDSTRSLAQITQLRRKCLLSKLLILDDFGFRRYDHKEAEILYEISDERLGKGTTIITSNRPIKDWYGVFPDPVIGGAILDRFVSGAVRLIIERARSYRKEGKMYV